MPVDFLSLYESFAKVRSLSPFDVPSRGDPSRDDLRTVQIATDGPLTRSNPFDPGKRRDKRNALPYSAREASRNLARLFYSRRRAIRPSGGEDDSRNWT